jgi:hypothetical protein
VWGNAVRCYEAMGRYDDAVKTTYKNGKELMTALKMVLDPGYRKKVDRRLVQKVAEMAAYALIKDTKGGGGKLRKDQMDLVDQALALFADLEVGVFFGGFWGWVKLADLVSFFKGRADGYKDTSLSEVGCFLGETAWLVPMPNVMGMIQFAGG